MIDKYTAMINYLRDCPAMTGILGVQTGVAADGALRITTAGSDAPERRKYIDGSVLRRFNFTIEFYKTLSYVPYADGVISENIEGMMDVEALISWIDDQMQIRNLPDFGEGYTIDSVESLNDQPNLAWLDAVNYDPPLAKYTVTIRVEYLDTTRAI